MASQVFATIALPVAMAASALVLPVQTAAPTVPTVRISTKSATTDTTSSVRIHPSATSSSVTMPANPAQWYYWTEAWQREERRALEELAAGESLHFDTAAELLAWLEIDEA